MALFDKQQEVEDSAALPDEVKEYYEAERKEHVGVAWLLAFVTLIVTMAVLGGLFVGGRWTYRQFANNDNDTTQTAVKTDNEPESSENSVSSGENKESTPEEKPTTEAPVVNKPVEKPADKPATTPPAITPSEAKPAVKPAEAPATTTPTTKPADDLSETGPGDTLAIFVGVSALSAIGHSLYSRRKQLHNFN